MASPIILRRAFFERDTKMVAKELLGKILVSQLADETTSGRIVETEAYLPRNDPACHANQRRSKQTETMFGRAGLAYVYPIHAKVCFNVVTEDIELGCAVLIRALEPISGIETMKSRRGLVVLKRLTTGPACLSQALGITREVNEMDLTSETAAVRFFDNGNKVKSSEILETVRIGVTSAQDRLLRFVIRNDPFVSGPKRLRV